MGLTGVRCLVCGYALDTDLRCSNPHCEAVWQCYSPLLERFGDRYSVVNLFLRINDLRGAVLPPAGQVITPITPKLVADTRKNKHNGGCLLVGGDDFEDLLCQTLIVPDDFSGERLILLLKVRADLPFLKKAVSSAENRVLSAVGIKNVPQKYITTYETQLVKTQLQEDLLHQICEKLIRAAKSLNYHFVSKYGPKDGVLQEYVEAYTKECKELLLSFIKSSDPNLVAMANHYLVFVEDLEDCIACAKSGDPNKWKKPKWITPFEVEIEQQVEVQKPVDSEVVNGFPYRPIEGILDLRNWIFKINNFKRYEFNAKGVLIDLDDNEYHGWMAIYYPYSEDVAFSLQGTLELISPAVNEVTDMLVTEGVYRLRQLNLCGTLASEEDAEYLYLARQAWALGITDLPEFRRIMLIDEAEELAIDNLMDKFAQDLAELDYEGDFHMLTQSLLLDAQRLVKWKRRSSLINLISSYLNLSPAEMISHPSYMRILDGIVITENGETGRGGAIGWNRLDAELTEQKEKFRDYYVYHEIKGNHDNLVKIIETGGLLWCSYKRFLLGISAGKTMSPDQDMETGGAGYLFGFVKNNLKSCHSTGIVWSAETFFANSAIYGYPEDSFGALSPHDRRYNKERLTTDLMELISYVNGEIMQKNFISIYGLHPLFIITTSEGERKKVLEAFEKVGVSEIQGRNIQEIVVRVD